MKRSYILSSALLCGAFLVSAGVEDEARTFLCNGDYTGALELARNALADNPKPASAAALNLTAGAALFNLGDYAEARVYLDKAKAKGLADAFLYLGRIAFMDYNFEEASSLYSRYGQLQKKARKGEDPGLNQDLKRIETAEAFMDRVEKLTVIDSIAVSRKDFFKAYRISPESGSLNPSGEFPGSQDTAPEFFYANEGRDYLLWSQPDQSGRSCLMESIRLTDGTWHEPVALDSVLNDGGDAIYPFLMPDGVTLYFANNGENSMGGYDIFVSNRDAEDGTYMTPQNLGMPYNSPFDDYMLAIDELTGTGWWATDRNRLDDDKITIYVFIPNDLRSNYDADDENLVDYARISDYKSTWEPGKDYAGLLDEIAAIDPSVRKKKVDFHFPIGGGKVYGNLDDFRTTQGRSLMQRYIDESDSFKKLLSELSTLRRKYHQSRSSELGSRIAAMEKDVDKRRESLRRLRGEIIKSEKSE